MWADRVWVMVMGVEAQTGHERTSTMVVCSACQVSHGKGEMWGERREVEQAGMGGVRMQVKEEVGWE